MQPPYFINHTSDVKFQDRRAAGKKLAVALSHLTKEKPLILALPRGGVEVAFEVAEMLGAPMTVLVVRKIGAPTNPEFGVGAVAENNVVILDKEKLKRMDISQKSIEEEKKSAKMELERRILVYRNGALLSNFSGHTVILIDDGLATGMTAMAAIESIKKLHPTKIVFAAPVCAYETAQLIKIQVQEFVCLLSPWELSAVGFYYKNFRQTSDEKVLKLLKKHNDIFLKNVTKYLH